MRPSTRASSDSCITADGPNNSFKPNLLRYSKSVAEKACHAFASTTQVGLTQALGASESNRPISNPFATKAVLAFLPACSTCGLAYRFRCSTSKSSASAYLGFGIFYLAQCFVLGAVRSRATSRWLSSGTTDAACTSGSWLNFRHYSRNRFGCRHCRDVLGAKGLLVMGLAPNNSFKPNPHRGVAWVLFRYASTQSPPRHGSA